ncbi:ARM repeat-containing protein [Punctularia strigosozonata HHB-11173 SS5]|uniref:ARM repeat-containing protein n=1 Tax=Punctularia strigosozonata (strain HHB-11173) TaxID=741275 RepID=UPI00044168D4|nr:ARM repeat-containing protein [Punctularia strigosozonata HHB-11173 SS5]EIN13206.1 ARM repeat-containing protein [Punctularia strigosozonata HHB-11173 SS5]
MSASLDPSSSPTDTHPSSNDVKALDLADASSRRGSNIQDLGAHIEAKRQEHAQARAMKMKLFEQQMRQLEMQQQNELLSIPYELSSSGFAVSAPTTPPRVNAALHPGNDSGPGSAAPLSAGHHPHFAPSSLHPQQQQQHQGQYAGNNGHLNADDLHKAVGSAADKRKSVTYAPSVQASPELGLHAPSGYGRVAGAKSMPASRRGSASEHDEELAGHLQGLSLAGEMADKARQQQQQQQQQPTVSLNGNSFGEEENGKFAGANGLRGHGHGNAFNAGMMLDEQLDQEMHNAMRNLPTPADDKYPYPAKVSQAALDLAPFSQASPRGPDSLAGRAPRRTATNPALTTLSGLDGATKLAQSVSATNTPLLPQGLSSRRGSPLGSLGDIASGMGAIGARSVPGTPLGGISSNSAAQHLLKTPGTPLTPDPLGSGGRLGDGDLGASLSRMQNAGSYDGTPLTFNSIGGGFDDGLQSQSQYGMDSVYNLDNGRYENYNFESNGRSNGNAALGAANGASAGSTALYQHGGSRYGLGMNGRIPSGDSKMNGISGPKHKRGEMELNRFAGTRLEDLQGEIPGLCKDQHGCRYLQKKLEEGIPEHRDMIFRETFGHFADLMTDPFGNYLCQKLLEYATDEQRNLICESVAQDLVNISLNMHGTRAVQKMIDFLSTRRQIHSIIVALSLHVVVLIKDLNGNHVIQKCLNKLAPEDNQFIYNAVAANCVEVATHRHGCCVLQRCIDHASDQQRVQLVNEITYNALTLVQDPYGNYVVQYILDLNDNRFSDGVIRQFTGNVCALSVQKFSSNVIEKCIRVAEHSTRKLLIEELLNRTRLEKLLRDSYGNYCVQTALDYAEPGQRALLVEGIRPVLPLIRNTPYGKRIQNKLQREQLDHYGGGYNQHMGGMPLGNQGLGMGHHGLNGGRHMSPQHMSPQSLHHTPSLSDIYGSQNSLYGMQGSGLQGQGGLPGLQPHSVDAYVLQGNSAHNQGLQGGFSPLSPFQGANQFGNGALTGALNVPYQRSTSFGYGM